MLKTEEEIDQTIERLLSSMAMSVCTLSNDDIADCRAILRGEKEGKKHLMNCFSTFKQRSRALLNNRTSLLV
jgi:hypothetical protein